MLSNLKIGTRLLIGFGLLAALMVGQALVARWGSGDLDDSQDEFARQSERLAKTHEMEVLVTQTSMLVSSSLVADQSQQAGLRESIARSRQGYLAILEELKATARTEEGRAGLKKVEDAASGWREVNQQMVQRFDAGEVEVAHQMFARESLPRAREVHDAVEALVGLRNRKLAEAHGAFHDTVSTVNAFTSVLSGLTLLIAIILGLVLTRGITRPLREVSAFLGEVAKGDVSHDIPEVYRERGDEIGQLAQAMQETTVSLRRSIRNVSEGVRTLAASATELSAISGQMSSSASEVAGRADSVAAAAEESSHSTLSVAASVEQATTNLVSVASATEQMTATISDIAQNSEKARGVTQQAMEEASRVSELVRELGRAAQEIGKVTETITSISAQTNLLALNATIEAARAGAAGKGFAVVANEIKELAQQTAAATEDIKNKIGKVQSSTQGTVQDIQGIARVIQEVNETVTTIATAIEEQSTVTRDIAGNIAQASSGVRSANELVAQSATVNRQIAGEIAEVNTQVGDITTGSEQVKVSSQELSRLSEQLQSLVQQFRV